MKTIENWNEALSFLEQSLDQPIDYEKVARIAGCTLYHFRRTFSFLSGMPLGEYVRRRRLSLAAIRLQQSQERIIDIASIFGYESPDSFARAFQNQHGIMPSDARKINAKLRLFSPMTFQLTIQGGNNMEYRIVEKEAFQFVGTKQQVHLVHKGANTQIDQMWAKLKMSDIEAWKAMSSGEPAGLLSATIRLDDSYENGAHLTHHIGVATNNYQEGKWDVLEIPASTWVVFTSRGPFPQTLQQVWQQIYTQWLPMSGYEVIEGPEMLWNEGPDVSKPDFHSEIWLPVQRVIG